MISSKRLSKVIQERESRLVENHLLEIYSALTKEQRQEIKNMFYENAKKS